VGELDVAGLLLLEELCARVVTVSLLLFKRRGLDAPSHPHLRTRTPAVTASDSADVAPEPEGILLEQHLTVPLSRDAKLLSLGRLLAQQDIVGRSWRADKSA